MTFLVNVTIWAHGGAVISVLERLEQLLCVREDIYTARQHSCFRALCKHLRGGLTQFLAAITPLLRSRNCLERRR